MQSSHTNYLCLVPHAEYSWNHPQLETPHERHPLSSQESFIYMIQQLFWDQIWPINTVSVISEKNRKNYIKPKKIKLSQCFEKFLDKAENIHPSHRWSQISLAFGDRSGVFMSFIFTASGVLLQTFVSGPCSSNVV